MVVFSMQHGMLWVGNPHNIDGRAGIGANQLGFWTGAMAQTAQAEPASSFEAVDLGTAEHFGENFARTLLRVSSVELA